MLLTIIAVFLALNLTPYIARAGLEMLDSLYAGCIPTLRLIPLSVALIAPTTVFSAPPKASALCQLTAAQASDIGLAVVFHKHATSAKIMTGYRDTLYTDAQVQLIRQLKKSASKVYGLIATYKARACDASPITLKKIEEEATREALEMDSQNTILTDIYANAIMRGCDAGCKAWQTELVSIKTAWNIHKMTSESLIQARSAEHRTIDQISHSNKLQKIIDLLARSITAREEAARIYAMCKSARCKSEREMRRILVDIGTDNSRIVSDIFSF